MKTVHSSEHPTLTPLFSQEFVLASLEREAVHHIFWLIHLLDIIASIYFKKPVTFTESKLCLRLPMEETSLKIDKGHDRKLAQCLVGLHLEDAPATDPQDILVSTHVSASSIIKLIFIVASVGTFSIY